jgi:hypothetical protein
VVEGDSREHLLGTRQDSWVSSEAYPKDHPLAMEAIPLLLVYHAKHDPARFSFVVHEPNPSVSVSFFFWKECVFEAQKCSWFSK